MVSVFISSTGKDLSEYRQAAIEVCNRLGFIPIAMEFFEAMGVGATAGSKRKLDGADVYVGIVSHRYGYIEQGYDKAVTELEFDYAGERGLDRLCFVIDPNHPWPPNFIDYENHEKLESFKNKIGTFIRAQFTSVDNFQALLIQTLGAWQPTPPMKALGPTVRVTVSQRLEFWKSTYQYESDKSIELAMRVRAHGDEKESKRIHIAEVCDQLRGSCYVILHGVAGAGKTFTLLQVAERLLSDESGPLPIFVSLPEWSQSGDDFVTFVAKELQISTDDLLALDHANRLAFLLNGWNEIPEARLDAATHAFRHTVRQFPNASFVVSTRDKESAPPLPRAENFYIERLVSEQRREIIARVEETDTQTIVQTIEGSLFLDELTRIPLFLSVAINIAMQGEEIPRSRYGLLKKFIEQAEVEHREALNSVCKGQHWSYLESLAAEMTTAGGASLPLDQALLTIGRCTNALYDKGVIGTKPDASQVLKVLIGRHLLTQSEAGSKTLRFHHQLFQEWFSAEWLYQKTRDIAPAPDHAIVEFQRDILNRTPWGNALSFLMERLRNDQGSSLAHSLASKIVRWMMPLDLFFAAQMSSLAGEQVWTEIGPELVRFLRDLYDCPSREETEYALAAMVATGRSDFADILWRLLESNDDQVRLPTYRVSSPFRLSCLGPKWQQRFQSHDEMWKAEFVSEMIHNSDHEQAQIITYYAKLETSVRVRLAAMEALDFCDETEFALELLDLENFALVGSRDFGRLLQSFPEHALRSIRPNLLALLPRLDSGPHRWSVLLGLGQHDDSVILEEMKKECDQTASLQAAETLIPAIHQRDPQWVSEWLIQKMLTGEALPEKWAEYLGEASPAWVNVLGAMVFTGVTDLKVLRAHLQILCKLAPYGTAMRTAKALLDEYRALGHGVLGSELPEGRCGIFERLLREQPYNLRVKVILALKDLLDSARELLLFLSFLGPAGPTHSVAKDSLSTEVRLALRGAVITWANRFLTVSQGTRWLRASLANLLGLVGNPKDIDILLKWLNDDRTEAKVERQRTGHPISASYTNWYVGALARLGSEESADALIQLLPDYLGEASSGLAMLAQGPQHLVSQDILWGSAYQDAVKRRRESNVPAERSTDRQSWSQRFARTIREFVEGLLEKHTGSVEERLSPHDCGLVAKALADLGDAEAIPLIVRLGSTRYCEYAVVEALERLLLKGIQLSAEAAMEVIAPLLKRIKTDPSWFGPHPEWLQVRCLSLLLLCDPATQGIAILRSELPKIDGASARDLIQVLRVCGTPEARQFLVELTRDTDFRSRWWYPDLLTALSQYSSPDTTEVLLEELARFSKQALGTDEPTNLRHALVGALSELAKTDPEMVAHFRQQAQVTNNPRERKLLASILSKDDGSAAVLASCYLLSDEADDPIPYEVQQAVEAAMTDRKPFGDTSSYTLIPKIFNPLRTFLFKLALTDQHRTHSAKCLLLQIENQRLKLGRPRDEPRHPDFDATEDRNTPWPTLCDSCSSYSANDRLCTAKEAAK